MKQNYRQQSTAQVQNTLNNQRAKYQRQKQAIPITVECKCGNHITTSQYTMTVKCFRCEHWLHLHSRHIGNDGKKIAKWERAPFTTTRNQMTVAHFADEKILKKLKVRV